MDICVCNFWFLISHKGIVQWATVTGQYPDNVRKTETIKVTKGRVLEFKAFNTKHDNQYSERSDPTCEKNLLMIIDRDGEILLDKSCGPYSWYHDGHLVMGGQKISASLPMSKTKAIYFFLAPISVTSIVALPPILTSLFPLKFPLKFSISFPPIPDGGMDQLKSPWNRWYYI